MLTKRYTENLEAYNLYLKGRYYWNKWSVEGCNKGLEYFQQALDKDPTYSLAYAGIADCYSLLTLYGYQSPKDAFLKAKVAAEKALEIDNRLAEAHAALAEVTYPYDYDLSAAERRFNHALELNPGHALAHAQYAIYLAYMGRHEESIAEAKRAHELDPLSLTTGYILGIIFNYARQYDRAIEEYQKTMEMDPNFLPPHIWLLYPYAHKGMYKEAIAEAQKTVELSGGHPSLVVEFLGIMYSLAGER